jgi:anti-sigma regulatory factor (Ser/Thr protein kinase)
MDELPIETSDDIVRVRQRVREKAASGGLSLVDQTKLVTAASELGPQRACPWWRWNRACGGG